MSEGASGSLSEARTTGMLHFFQCLLFSTLATDGSPSFLLAASRSHIFVFSAEDGKLLSTWQSNQCQAVDLQSTQSRADEVGKEESARRPTKRRKKGSPDDESESSSAEIVTEDGRQKTRKSSKPIIMEPNVITLAATSDGQAIVAVTDEDKSIRVLSLGSNGALQQLSQRQDDCYHSVDYEAEY